MFKNIKQLYSLAVCFVCIMILMVTLGTSIHDIIHYMNPEYYQRYALERYKSNEEYIASFSDEKKRKEFEKIPEEKMTEMRLQKREEYLKDQKGELPWTLLDKLPWAVTALLFFILHWAIYRRASKEKV
jgi:hypothetical protein